MENWNKRDTILSECGVIYCMEAFDLSPYITLSSALEERETTLIERSSLTHSQSMDEDLFKSITTSSITKEVDLRHQQEEKLTVPFPWNTLWDVKIESTSVPDSKSRYESRPRAYAFIDYSATHILPGLDLSYTHNRISVTEVVPRKKKNLLNRLKCRLFKM